MCSVFIGVFGIEFEVYVKDAVSIWLCITTGKNTYEEFLFRFASIFLPKYRCLTS